MEKKITNYAVDPDSEALSQFKECYNQPFVVSASLMPDAHSGYAAPIGAVLLTKGYIVPAWVGFDIGCGMIAVELKGKGILEAIKKNSEKIYQEVKRKVPMGMGEFNKEKDITPKTLKEFNSLIKKFQEKEYDKEILNFLKTGAIKHLGTLGGGNHFIELSYDGDEGVWLVIHSGSRGVGYKVADKYMQKAANSTKNYEKTFPLDVNSRLGKEYLNVLNFGLEYALLNRLEMSYKVIGAIEKVIGRKVQSNLWTNKNHNHAVPEKELFIHRKGATPANKKERGVIPANMRDGSFLVEGLGNPSFLFSSSHGAGRVISRKKAKEKFTMEEFKKSMEGITGTVSKDFIDEAPMAYKDISKVMDAQKKSVKIVNHLLPIINWKGK